MLRKGGNCLDETSLAEFARNYAACDVVDRLLVNMAAGISATRVDYERNKDMFSTDRWFFRFSRAYCVEALDPRPVAPDRIAILQKDLYQVMLGSYFFALIELS